MREHPTLNFKDRTAIVTGATRGIGKAICELLLDLECKVIATGTKPNRADTKTPPGAEYQPLDFLDPASIAAFKTSIANRTIDILINNAGIHRPQPIYEIDEDIWDKILKVNLYGPMTLTREVAHGMKTNRYGRIVNISSIAGIVSKPGQSAYSASKSGLIGLTRSTALDLAPHGILVNALCPGTTQTDMVEIILTEEQKAEFKKNIPLGRFAKVEEIANIAAFLCSDLNTYITGQTIVADGGTIIQ